MSVVAAERCDIAIAGGGMVGLSLAVALGELPVDVVVIEPVTAEENDQPSFDARATALSAGSRRVLEGIGVWPLVSRQATPIRRIHVSERGAFGTASLSAAEQGLEALGHTIENCLLGTALRDRAARLHRLRQCHAGVRGVETGMHAVQIETDAGDCFGARLLVAADGARSVVRRALGIESRILDYGQHAIVAHVETSRFHEYTAWERFTPSGPLAVLPIAEGRAAVVWTLAPGEASRVLAMPDEDFVAELQHAFGMRLGRFTRVGRRQSYPLALTTAERLVAPRSVVLGNAAQSLHPVAGQGFNLALRDVAVLAELLAGNSGQDPGSRELLDRYAQWRAPDRKAVVRFTDSLVRGFGLPLATVRGLRAASLVLFDLLPPVKREFARRTMGLAGRQPRLVRGLPLLPP